MGQLCFTIRWTGKRTLHQVSHATTTLAPSAYRLNTGSSPADKLRSLPGNDRCADCNRLGPDWAVKNHGVLICIRCAGVHRRMGTHISVVQHLTADTWDDDDISSMRGTRGNRAVNRTLEAKLPSTFTHTALIGDDDHLERFIRSKYESGVFLKEGDGQLMLATNHPAMSTSKVAMVEYVGLVFIELLAARELPAANTCFGTSPPYVVFSTSGQSARTVPAKLDGLGAHYWRPAGKVSLNCKTTGSAVAVQVYCKDILGNEQVLAVGSLQLTKGMAERSRQLVQLTSTVGTMPQDRGVKESEASGPAIEVLVSLHIIT
jgi:hypothetical protein